MPTSLQDLMRMQQFPSGQVNFAAPWEARVFALALSLSKSGSISWNEFRDLLIAEIAIADAADRAGDAAPSYYECWLAAFEKLIVSKGMTDHAEVSGRAEVIAANPPERTKARSSGPVRIA